MADQVSDEARKAVNDKIADTKASDMSRTMAAGASSKERREKAKREREQREKEAAEKAKVGSPVTPQYETWSTDAYVPK